MRIAPVNFNQNTHASNNLNNKNKSDVEFGMKFPEDNMGKFIQDLGGTEVLGNRRTALLHYLATFLPSDNVAITHFKKIEDTSPQFEANISWQGGQEMISGGSNQMVRKIYRLWKLNHKDPRPF